MSAYIHGSLAVSEAAVKQRAKVKETRRIVYRSKTLPTQEKLLYLFTIVICCVVAGVIIFRHAQIYEMNVRMQQIERDIKRLEIENNELKLQVDRMQSPERLIEAGRQLGLLQQGELASKAQGKPQPPASPQAAPSKPSGQVQTASAAKPAAQQPAETPAKPAAAPEPKAVTR